MKKLDIGGGLNPRKGFLSVDMCDGADVYCNLENGKLPFESNSIDEIHTQHTLEHITNLIPLMNELWRIMKDGATLNIIVPHSDSVLAYGDPTHVRFFNAHSMKYFEGYYINKYKLNYGIKCAFVCLINDTRTIDEEVRYGENKPYFIEQNWLLKKDLKYFEENKPFYLKEEVTKKPEQLVTEAMAKGFKLFEEKNKAYDNSYFKADDVERYSNLKRKWARIEAFINGTSEPDFETIEDTLTDLGNYCYMEIAKRNLEK